jgi:hypothetical protein
MRFFRKKKSLFHFSNNASKSAEIQLRTIHLALSNFGVLHRLGKTNNQRAARTATAARNASKLRTFL